MTGTRIDDTPDARVTRELLSAYRAGDRAAAEEVIGAEFVFTSPQDDHIDRATWFERCFPTADRFVRQDLLAAVDCGDGHVFVLYEYELADGGAFRNTEYLTVRDGRLVEAQVFFGGRVR